MKNKFNFMAKTYHSFLPQSDVTASNEKEQNVQFVEQDQLLSSVDSHFDSLRDVQMLSGTDLDAFFSRPIRIDTFLWTVNDSIFRNINPWMLFFQNPRVINRITNYRLLRCKLHVKFIINGNPFCYGRAIASYNPFPSFDVLTRMRTFFLEDIVEASQRPHVMINPCLSLGGEMHLPFFWFENVLDIPNVSFDQMGTINIRSFDNLLPASTTSTPVRINIFAWATDVVFSTPTQFEPSSLVPQSDEYTVKPVSRTATAVANFAKRFTDVPLLAPYAIATQIGASAVSAIANLFGFSKPNLLNRDMLVPTTKCTMANFNNVDDCCKLSLDQKQELSIDPRIAGLGGEDELTILSISMRPTWFDAFSWDTTDLTEKLLYNIIVDPCLIVENFSAFTEHHLTACAFATYPFEYWRGTMRYTFDVVCTNFHKGRLKFVYDPVATAITAANPEDVSAEYNVAFTTIVDISESTVVTIDIPWSQPLSYNNHAPFPNGAPLYSESRLNYTSYINNFGNGTLSIYVVNELQAPSDIVGGTVYINSFVSTGEDFEVACPTNKYISRMSHVPDLRNSFVPQSETVTIPAKKVPTDTTDNLIHFGETVKSFRQLMKRYCFSEYIPLANDYPPNNMMCLVSRYQFPLDGGYLHTDPTLVTAMPVYGTDLGQYVYANFTYLHYITRAFGGWRGSIRYAADTSAAGCCSVSTIVSHDHLQTFPYQKYANPPTICDCGTSPLALGTLYNFSKYLTDGPSGISVQNNSVNTMHSFEVPFYSKYRFFPAKTRTIYNNIDTPVRTDPFQRNWYLITKGQNIPHEANMALYCAAGEDFTPLFYLGSPVIFENADYPLV